MAEAAAEHPPPPHAHAAPEIPEGETSERLFKRRLIKDLTTLNIRDMRKMWSEELFEPHMHLFVILVIAFAMGITIWALRY